MADYYTSFSAIVPTGCPKQRRFFMKMLQDLAFLSGYDEWEETGLEVEPEKGTDELWVHSMYGGQGLVLDTVAEWQAKFKKMEPWYLSWAHTCSKPRLDSFSGGSGVAFRGEVHSCDPEWEIKKLVEELEARDCPIT